MIMPPPFNDIVGEIRKRARMEREHLQIPSLNNQFANNILMWLYQLPIPEGEKSSKLYNSIFTLF